MLDYLGFEWSNDPEGANVIISNNSTDVKSLIEQGIPYIGLSYFSVIILIQPTWY